MSDELKPREEIFKLARDGVAAIAIDTTHRIKKLVTDLWGEERASDSDVAFFMRTVGDLLIKSADKGEEEARQRARETEAEFEQLVEQFTARFHICDDAPDRMTVELEAPAKLTGFMRWLADRRGTTVADMVAANLGERLGMELVGEQIVLN